MFQHSDYWNHHLGGQWLISTPVETQLIDFDAQRPYAASSVRIDIRVPGFARARDCLAWTRENFASWMLSAAMLCRISPPNPRLRCLHLRLSAHAEMYHIVEAIIAGCPGITDIVIEDDSHPELDGLPRPMLDFSSFASEGRQVDYSQLERLVIRAPALRLNAVDCEHLFGRLNRIRTLCLAVHELTSRTPIWAWVLSAFARAPCLQQAEVSIGGIDCYDHVRRRLEPASVNLPALKHLMLDLPQVDARLLGRLHAPALKCAQFRSSMAIGTYGDLQLHHFPALFCLTVWCPGGAADRFKALGLRQRQYIHNIPRRQRGLVNHDEPILVYVVPVDPNASLPDVSSLERPSKRPRMVTHRSIQSTVRPPSV
ncbi:hypothetical protein OC844_005948 [Tilletia horrida]|nr:hypothetical protein OC844_005948 [Tilletia horrida]